ncbi:MAG: hypothetical protein FWG30_10245 [Eubacteriaceae bacterium]|nr:hypothetical protein [Eubacteriaceae bacterium]
MRTGIAVDFRETEWLRAEEGENAVPLLWPYNFNGYRIAFPIESKGKPQYLLNTLETQRLQMQKGNYLLLKRFTSKEERKRLQCCLLFEDDYLSFPSISTENHLNYIAKLSGKMGREELYGLFAVLNSSYMDNYFRILNGSTQVNANEINSLPFPSYSDIIKIGREAAALAQLSEAGCDAILEDLASCSSAGRAI